MSVSRAPRFGLRTLALAYLTVLVLVPVGYVIVHALKPGIGGVFDSLTTPAAQHAIQLTIEITVIAVVANTIFGMIAALVLERTNTRLRYVIDLLIDLPFAVSPVVVGLALLLLYGRQGWFGPWLSDHGIRIVFSMPGMILATVFVALPFVAREVAPALREAGTEQEQAAATLGATRWQAFWRITVPSVRSALAYGVVLSTARALGEFGAVSVVSGRIAGQTITLPLLVQQRYQNFDQTGAYVAAAFLAVISLLVLLAMTVLSPGRRR
jgi:sulfate/thiosulfate transport system permease protein